MMQIESVFFTKKTPYFSSAYKISSSLPNLYSNLFLKFSTKELDCFFLMQPLILQP